MKAESSAFFDMVTPAIDASLQALLPPEATPPARIHQAMRYSIFAGGKRLRPALCIAGFSLYQSDWKPVLPVACAFEMIHTYSLIHDDLPAMDDDDFRRGIPSCHKKYGEAIAILAGDALLTFAFETLAQCEAFPPDRMLRAVSMLSEASGAERGMIAGQVFDLEAEGVPIHQVDVERIHRSKTAAIITSAVSIGAYLGGAPELELDIVRSFGQRIGLAFQIVDDILDETTSLQTLGKTGGKDREQKKATYPALHGLEQSRTIVHDMTQQARVILQPLGSRAEILLSIADYLETRWH
jgi:geranylgeranyl diphosphate synthase type II